MILNSEVQNSYVSIGELSKLTGVGIHTLRVWERRYGVPTPVRLPSNHRRYPVIEVNRVQAITKALESGYKLNKVIGKTLRELDFILNSGDAETNSLNKAQEEIGAVLSNWLDATILYDDDLLNQGLRNSWNKCDPVHFITDYIVPFIKKVGIAWESQELTISQEHFASALLSNFLSEKWKKLNDKKGNTNVVLANIPGETHKLGLQMCAVVTAFSDNGIVFLGSDNSCEEIVSVIEDCNARILGISVSSCFDQEKVKDYLSELKTRLSKRVLIAVGGEGTPDTLPGIAKFSEFSHYYKWLTEVSD